MGELDHRLQRIFRHTIVEKIRYKLKADFCDVRVSIYAAAGGVSSLALDRRFFEARVDVDQLRDAINSIVCRAQTVSIDDAMRPTRSFARADGVNRFQTALLTRSFICY